MLATQPQSMTQGIVDQYLNLAYVITSVFTMPIEMILRPLYSTRYFPPEVLVLSALLMAILPIFGAVTGVVTQVLSFGRAAPQAFVSLGEFSRLFFLLALIHGIRLNRLQRKPWLESNSEIPGPPLPFIRWIPFTGSYWKTRIIVEPAFVIVLACFMQNMLIFQAGLSNYLCLAGVMLALKNYIAWFTSWQYIRKLLDAKFAAPIISKMVNDQASQDELASINMQAFPSNLPEDVRKDAAIYIAKAYGVETNEA